MQIQLNNLTMRFGPQTVLNQISATIKEGKTTAIVGPSGTGKSVLLKLITGLLEPTAGEVIIGNTNFTSSNASIRSNICHKIGMLFQGAALFDSLTLFENIEFPFFDLKFPKLSNSRCLSSSSNSVLHLFLPVIQLHIRLSVKNEIQ